MRSASSLKEVHDQQPEEPLAVAKTTASYPRYPLAIAAQPVHTETLAWQGPYCASVISIRSESAMVTWRPSRVANRRPLTSDL
jgi:hypothetical protein